MRSDLVKIVGTDHVMEATGEWLVDASRVTGLRGRADAVVRPGTAEETAAVVAWCYARGIAVVPRGGGTGYAGGAVPGLGDGRVHEGVVVLATERLDRVRSLDPGLWRMEVEAGVRTATVQRLARENGLRFPVDPGAAESSTIGGNVATNAGGPHCFKHGVMRAWVTGLEAVLAPGELVRVGGPVRKDVAGYDLVGLLTGSEGTLGIVTAAWLRLIPAPEIEPIPLAASYPDLRAGQDALERVLACGTVPAAIELLDAGALRASAAGYPGILPTDAALLLLVEADGGEDDAAELAEALGAHAQRPDPVALWRWRDGVGLAVSAARGGKLSEDVGVPLDRIAEAIEGTNAIAAAHGLEAVTWGHAGDGNLHSTFLLDLDDPAQLARADAAAQDLFGLVLSLGGTVSGEHGLGWLKRGQLDRQWDAAAVAAHRAVKRALDPAGLFNPGKKD